ncbi:MAG: hypothetical protein HOL51_07755 [Gemmatimonadetes bacterium]|nr:hypothetical protein [Gemmatimonadota bacterium]MBT5326002.1 hypothetical protein [Gemmatimonadota bacterium]MBT5453050.1 hypothetical protein [Gemmatimonadota bacterium]MBT5802204.1 hypothetical protein [Gemmatimonadota bacterium]MBT6623335.1 hypothetical protein [Gemmatimonadota bacterium]
MAYKQLDNRQIHVQPLAVRASKHDLGEIRVDPDASPPDPGSMAPAIAETITAIRRAREQGAAVMLAYGAHLVKNGLGPIVARLLETGWITHLATNGAGTIHDWEYAYGGRSEEDVRSHVAAGCFGTWDETGRYIHLAVSAGAVTGMGYGEALGHFIAEDGCALPERAALTAALSAWAREPTDDPLMPARAELLQTMIRNDLPAGFHRVVHPHKDFSLTAAAYQMRVPLTVHPGIGYDIICNNPAANGAVLGRGADTDYRTFAHSVMQLDGGVFLSVGSAIMAPQVFEKATSFANNLRRQQGLGPIQPFILVNDLAAIDWDWRKGEPPQDNPAYYLRFCKSFSRMGGEMVYAGGDNKVLLTNLWAGLRDGTAYDR